MIELQNVQKVVRQDTLIAIKSLTVMPGEIAALVGPPGNGKDTIFQLLTGQIRPTLGRVSICQIHPIEEKEAFSRKVGVLFAEDGLYERRSPLDNLTFYCRLYGLPDARAREVLEQVGLADHAGARLQEMPSGLLRRLAFGRAILQQPGALLLMQPFARCDESSISLIKDLILQFAGDGGTALILADDPAHLHAICDTIHLLRQGRITESYQPEQQGSELPFKIPARQDEKVILINPADILYAFAEGGSVYVQTISGKFSTQQTLSDLDDTLSPRGFFRAHRSYLVNLQRAKEIIPYTRSTYTLRLDDEEGTEIPLSRSSIAELRELFGF